MSISRTSRYFHKKHPSDSSSPFSPLLSQGNYSSKGAAVSKAESSFPFIFNSTHKGFKTPTATRSKLSIQSDTIELTSFYQTQSRNKQGPSKEEKHLFYTKYNIKTSPKVMLLQSCKKAPDLSISIPSTSVYFKNVAKAIKTLEVNEQIVKQVHRLNSQYQIDSYSSNINSLEVYRNQLAKMPKVRVQKMQLHPKGDNTNKRASVVKRRAEIIPFLRISRDMFMNNDVKLSIDKLADIRTGPKPTSRAMFSLILYGYDCFVFGGMNALYLNEMWLFKLSSHQWIRVQCSDEPLGRCGASSVIINEHILIYGGTYPMNIMKPPEDILQFNLFTKKFSSPQVFGMKKVGKRRAHIGVAVGQTMLVHGGYDEDNKMLNSAFIMSMPKFSWNELIINEGVELPYLAHHSAQVISDDDKKAMEGERYTIYKPPAELIKNTSSAIIKHKGIYIFGGLMPNYEMNSEVYVISIGKIPCDVFKLKTQGIGPSARINCSMIYINQLNSIIIHGGEDRVTTFNDFFVLDIERLTWKQAVNSQELVPRTEHRMFYHEGRLMILGGRNEKIYLKMDFASVEFIL